MFENVITTKIEIAAPPAEVRNKFLQFDQIPTYHPNGFIKSIATATPNTPIEIGTKMHIVIELGTMEPPIIENTPKTFCWAGRGLLGTFNGNHAFHFTQSATTPGGTTLIQEEHFSGLLAFLVGEGMVGSSIGLREKTRAGFEGFNRDFKRWVEGGK